MAVEHFKTAEGYRKWNAYRHMHGIPAPHLKVAVVAGHAHKVHHSALSLPFVRSKKRRGNAFYGD